MFEEEHTTQEKLEIAAAEELNRAQARVSLTENMKATFDSW